MGRGKQPFLVHVSRHVKLPYDFSYFDLIRATALVTSLGTNRCICKNLKQKGKERREMRDSTTPQGKRASQPQK